MIYKTLRHNKFDEIVIEINNFKVSLLNLGATLKSIKYKTAGKEINALLEYENIKSYEDNDIFLGATLGRFAGRIKYDPLIFTRDIRNNGNNVLHGGVDTSANIIWEYSIAENEDSITVSFSHLHKDDGFPGELNSKVIYTISENNIKIEYESMPIGESICNITNHAYFSLGENDTNDLLFKSIDSEVALTNKEQLPTGKYQKIPNEITFKDLDKMYPETRGIDNPVKFDGKIMIKSEMASVEITSSYNYVVLYTQSYESKHNFSNSSLKTKNGVAVELQNIPNNPINYTKKQKHFIEYKFS